METGRWVLRETAMPPMFGKESKWNSVSYIYVRFSMPCLTTNCIHHKAYIALASCMI